MRQEEIDERLVDWELARQRGEEFDLGQLLAEAGPWHHYVQERLEVLRKTAWMLEDPVPGSVDPWISKMVSQTEVTVREQQTLKETPFGEDRPRGKLPAESLPAGKFPAPVPPTQGDAQSALAPGVGALPDQMPELPGFRCLARLGKGGFGVVFRALDETLQRQVAIKFPLLDGQREQQKYMAEARHAARADVPGIVPIYHVGQTSQGTPYVIQKLIEGKSLREILKFGGCLSPAQAGELFVKICQAVAAAHSQALVHRDLKPENVLIDQQGMPWITDFGLSIAEDDPNLRAASIAGTPNFMSPEQIMGKVEWLDGRCDIWALGVMLYQCLTGRLPFHSHDTLDLHERILHFEPRPISQRQPGIAKEWDQIFRKCCAKSIADRYSSALEMAEDLQQLAAKRKPAVDKHNPLLVQLQGGDPGLLPGTTSRGGLAAVPLARLTPIQALLFSTAGLVLLVTAIWLYRAWKPTGELIVASDGSGTHSSIAAAVLAAGENTSIFIEPGVYRESLTIARKVTLRGRGDREAVLIVGADGPAFTVNDGGQLGLNNVSVAVDDETQGTWNAIDVHGGELLLNRCRVLAAAYDCLHLTADSKLVATDCEFETSVHPAIFAQLADELTVRDCHFQIGPQDPAETRYLAGMQVIQSPGSVSDCNFAGNAAVGIEWSDTQELVTIDDCQFEQLQRAIIATSCGEFRVGGHGRAAFDNCHTAIEMTGSGGGIKNCFIQTQDLEQSRGILIRGLFQPDEPIGIEACRISGVSSPLVLSQSRVQANGLVINTCDDMGVRLLDNSELELVSSQILNCEVAGLLIEGSRASLLRCTLESNLLAGIVVDGLEQALVARSCLIDANDVGLVVLSGAAHLEHTTIQGATTGVLLARRHQLTFKATCDWQLSLVAEGGAVRARQNAIHFLSPGSYRLVDCDTSDPQDRPVLDPTLERVTTGENVSVRLRDNVPSIQ